MRKLAVFTMVAALMSSGAVALADGKLYSGSSCNPVVDGPTDGLSVTGHTSHFFVIVPNASGEASCPLDRDSTSDIDGMADLELNLLAGVAGTALCTAASISISGASLQFANRSRTTTGKLDWGNTLNGSISHTPATPGNSYVLFCDLPASWGITTYFIDE